PAGKRRVQGFVRVRLFFLRANRPLFLFVQRGLANQGARADWRFPPLVALRRCPLVCATPPRPPHPAGNPRDGAIAELVHIESHASASATGSAATVPEKPSDGIVRMSSLHPNRSC